MKGPTFLYGPSSLSGTVNLVCKQPAQKRFADVSLSYGRFGTFEGTVDGNVASGDGTVSFRLNGVYQGTNQHRYLPNGSVGAVDPTLLWRPDDEHRITVGFEYARATSRQTDPLRRHGRARLRRPQTPPPSTFDDSLQNVYRVRFDAERKLAERLPALRKKSRLHTEYVLGVPGDAGERRRADPGRRAGRTRPHDPRRPPEDLRDQLEAMLMFDTGPRPARLPGGIRVHLAPRPLHAGRRLPPPRLPSRTPSTTAAIPSCPSLRWGWRATPTATVLAPYVVDPHDRCPNDGSSRRGRGSTPWTTTTR